ncbi:MAG TPA: TonB family protein [Burkholderiaceae bacterium]|jgi:protein TonB|nr:TonB family protein [Burkholderiaceae bacterium]
MQLIDSWFSDRVLMAALMASAGMHALVLAVRFVDPELLRMHQTDPMLEIVLVNAKSAASPSKPQALAQANLEGGGTQDEGRRSSPFPNLSEEHDGDTIQVERKSVERLEQEQRQLLAMVRKMNATTYVVEQRKQSNNGTEHPEAYKQQLARMEAEISREISDYQQRPRRHHFMPSTSEYRFARYFEDWRARVEKVGNENYPEEARGRIYGSLQMTVVINRSGSLLDAIIERSSGSAVLDRAARRIVKLAAPYPPFPPEIARDTDVLEITRTWMFTNDQFGTRAIVDATAGRH